MSSDPTSERAPIRPTPRLSPNDATVDLPSVSAEQRRLQGNLLWLLLGVRNQLLTWSRAALVVQEWQRDKRLFLGKLLLDRGAIADDAFQLLNALVKKHLELHANDPRRSLEALPKLGSLRQTLAPVADAEVTAVLEYVGVNESGSAVGESSAHRPLRWIRRHRAAAAALGLVLVALLAASVVGMFLSAAHQRKVVAALEEKQRAIDEAAKSNAKLQANAAITGFQRGLADYEQGRTSSAIKEFRKALSMLPPEHPQRQSFQRVLLDRTTHGGTVSPVFLRHADTVGNFAVSPDGTQVVTYVPRENKPMAHRWDLRSGALLESLDLSATLHSAGGTAAQTILERSDLSVGFEQATWSPTKFAVVAELFARVPELKTHRVLEFDPKTSRLLTASKTGTGTWSLHYRDARAGTQLGPPVDLGRESPRVVVRSFDGTRLFVAAESKGWMLDGATGNVVHDKIDHEKDLPSEAESAAELIAAAHKSRGVAAVSFSRSGNSIATAAGATVRIWNATTGTALGAPLVHDDAVESVAFGRDGRLVLTRTADHRVQVWDAETSKPARTPLVFADRTVWADFIDAEDNFLVRTNDEVSLWNLRGTDAIARLKFPSSGSRYPRNLECRAIPGTRSVAVSGAEASSGVVAIWNIDYREARRSTQADLSNSGMLLESALFRDDSLLVVQAPAADALLWVEFETPHRPTPGAIGSTAAVKVKRSRFLSGSSSDPIAFLAGDSMLLARRIVSSELERWDVKDARPLESKWLGGFEAISADRRTVATASRHDGSSLLRFWNAETAAPLGTTTNYSEVVMRSVFDAAAKRFATGGDDGRVRVWNVESGAAVVPPVETRSSLDHLQFSPQGNLLATAHDAPTLKIWSVAERLQPVAEKRFSGDGFRRIDRIWFNADGSRLFVVVSVDSGEDSVVTISTLDSRTAAPFGPTISLPARQANVAVSPDGSTILMAVEGFARLWDAATGSPIGVEMRFEKTGLGAAEMRFNRDGTLIFADSFEKKGRALRVFDGRTGAMLGIPMRHREGISLAFSPTDNLVVTPGDEGLDFWSTAPGPLLDDDVLEAFLIVATGDKPLADGGFAPVREAELERYRETLLKSEAYRAWIEPWQKRIADSSDASAAN